MLTFCRVTLSMVVNASRQTAPIENTPAKPAPASGRFHRFSPSPVRGPPAPLPFRPHTRVDHFSREGSSC
jgi:hypothetical protein